MSDSLSHFATEKLSEIEKKGLRRSLAVIDRRDGIWVQRAGRRLLSFSSNDYLNMSQHPSVKAAAVRAIEAYGVGAAASRLVTGNHPLYPVLEQALAEMMETEDACVFSSGYVANMGIVPVLAGPRDLIVIDEFAHGCLHAGARLAGARIEPFRHNDVAHARDLLGRFRGQHARAMVLTDAVFSQDGDIAPLAALQDVARSHDAWLMSDDAHGIGVVGQGRGGCFVNGEKVDVPLKMGTLGKAIGAQGGYLCASRPVIDLIKNRSRPLGHSTALPPATVAAIIEALRIVRTEPALVARPLDNARLFAKAVGLPQPATPILPLILGTEEAAVKASAILLDNDILVHAMRPPVVPAGTARLRIIFTAGHTEADILKLSEIVKGQILPLVRHVDAAGQVAA